MIKKALQWLIRRDIVLRGRGKRPDKIYWADKLYARLYGLNDKFYDVGLLEKPFEVIHESNFGF